MAQVPTTRPSLLLRLRDPRDAEAWRDFVRAYAPVVYNYGRKRGLQDADAADLTQEVLRGVAGAMPRWEYNRRRGSFSGWLFTIAHHKCLDLLNHRQQQVRGSGDTAMQWILEQQPAAEERAAWQEEYDRRLFNWAAEQVRASFHDITWRAFWLTAVEGKRGKEVAAELALTVAAVYLARSRVMARLRAKIEELERIGFDVDEPDSVGEP